MNKQKKHICVTGDIIASRSSEYSTFLHNFPKILNDLNNQLLALVPFRIISGDEFQGLLSIDQNPFDFIDFLEYRLFPLRFRTGIGIGSIDTEIQESTFEMRGSVFECARLALELAKKSERSYTIRAEQKVYLLDDLLLLLGFIKRKWNSEMVFRRYFLYRSHGTAQEVAKLEHVSTEAVNKFIKKHGFREIMSVTHDFHRSIQELFV